MVVIELARALCMHAHRHAYNNTYKYAGRYLYKCTSIHRHRNSAICVHALQRDQDLSDLAQLKIVQERKSALIAMLSHEIRSPLHGMVGLTTAMLESQARLGPACAPAPG